MTIHSSYWWWWVCISLRSLALRDFLFRFNQNFLRILMEIIKCHISLSKILWWFGNRVGRRVLIICDIAFLAYLWVNLIVSRTRPAIITWNDIAVLVVHLKELWGTRIIISEHAGHLTFKLRLFIALIFVSFWLNFCVDDFVRFENWNKFIEFLVHLYWRVVTLSLLLHFSQSFGDWIF